MQPSLLLGLLLLLLQGSVALGRDHVLHPRGQAFKAGNFVVDFTAPDLLRVYHVDLPAHVLWQTISGTPFVSSAIGDDSFSPGNGHFDFRQNNTAFCQAQSVQVSQQGDSVLVQGNLSGGGCNLPYRFVFMPVSANQLGFEVTLSDPSNRYDRIFLTYASATNEKVFGFGEQFSFFDAKGERIPILTREQGVGRGLQPITFILNREGKFAGGDRYTTYIAIPHYITSQNRSLFLENSEFMIFDLSRADRIVAEVASTRVVGRIVFGRSPLDLIEEYTSYSGRMKPLPDWINKGAVVGMQGGEVKVRQVLEELEKRGTPVGAFWNQDWCGNRIQYVGGEVQKRLWWNWEPDREVYPNWENLLEFLMSKDIRMMIYINTFLTDVSNKTSYQRNMFKEALAAGYFAKNPDGTPFLIESGPGIEAGLIDLTNPDLVRWMKEIIKENMIGTGSFGWMADFGEYLSFDALLANGDSRSYKNLYPQEWAKLNQEAAEEAGLGDEIVYFMRAGYNQSPKYTSLFWAGDQLPTWDLYDGLKSVVAAMLTSGISGFAFQHSDIAGFSTNYNEPPLPSYVREKELLFRWSELSAFTTTFRTHEGSQPDKNVQFYTDDETYANFAYCAKMYASLAPYRKQLMAETAAKGYPMVRHLFLHYPLDAKAAEIIYNEYLFGEDLLVVPVLDEGVREVKAYLPQGKWVHVWSESLLGSEKEGMEVTVEAPIGEPGIFVREEAMMNPNLGQFLAFARLRGAKDLPLGL